MAIASLALTMAFLAFPATSSGVGVVSGTPCGGSTKLWTGAEVAGHPASITAGPDGDIWFAEAGAIDAIGRLSLSNCTITEFPLPAGSPRSIATGPDGNLWFTIAGKGYGAIGRMSASGKVTGEFSAGLSEGSTPSQIVPGPDGSLWFLDDRYPNMVGRVTTAGVIKEGPSAIGALLKPSPVEPTAISG